MFNDNESMKIKELGDKIYRHHRALDLIGVRLSQIETKDHDFHQSSSITVGTYQCLLNKEEQQTTLRLAQANFKRLLKEDVEQLRVLLNK